MGWRNSLFYAKLSGSYWDVLLLTKNGLQKVFYTKISRKTP